MYDIYYNDEEYRREAPEDKVSRRLDMFVRELSLEGDFSLTFVSDDEIRSLNREYRNRDEATDILTFALSDGEQFPQPDGGKELGDVFISLDAMKRNAAAFSCPEDEELGRLLLHGLMHLQGYDHQSNDFTSEPMLVKQEEILAKLAFDC